jgi:16S rRNA processing protein RimM
LLSNTPGFSLDNPAGDFIVLGTIVRPHGLKGEVKVNLSCSGINRLTSSKTLVLVRNGKELKKVSVIRAFLHNDGDAVVRFNEVQGPEEAETLRGVYVAVPLKDREPLPENQYYMDDLMGLAVETPEGKKLGVIDEIMEGPANAVLVVKRDGEETLVPVLKSVVQKIDLKAKQVVVDLPEEIDEQTAD